MKKTFYFPAILILLFTWLLSPLCFALISPTVQFQQVADRMISQLENNKSQLHKMSIIRSIVNKILLPNVDLDRMSASVVGRYWRSATSVQQNQFKKEFSYMVTTTYASALSSYDDDKVNVHPLRENYATLQTVRVNSVIIRKNGQRIPITYDVVRHGDSWKVYDFSIEHVSMVQSYRSQFANVLASGGMSALLSRLQYHNQVTK